MMPAMPVMLSTSSDSCIARIMGTPPATAASKPSWRRDENARRTSGSASASSALFAVTTCLPRAAAPKTRSRAGEPVPPIASTTMSISGSSRTARGSAVTDVPGSTSKSRRFATSRHRSYREDDGPGRLVSVDRGRFRAGRGGGGGARVEGGASTHRLHDKVDTLRVEKWTLPLDQLDDAAADDTRAAHCDLKSFHATHLRVETVRRQGGSLCIRAKYLFKLKLEELRAKVATLLTFAAEKAAPAATEENQDLGARYPPHAAVRGGRPRFWGLSRLSFSAVTVLCVQGRTRARARAECRHLRPLTSTVRSCTRCPSHLLCPSREAWS